MGERALKGRLSVNYCLPWTRSKTKRTLKVDQLFSIALLSILVAAISCANACAAADSPGHNRATDRRISSTPPPRRNNAPPCLRARSPLAR